MKLSGISSYPTEAVWVNPLYLLSKIEIPGLREMLCLFLSLSLTGIVARSSPDVWTIFSSKPFRPRVYS